jgi:hypothetical protein
VKLVMTLLVRDEIDIIEWNLQYHLARGVDHFVVMDNRSVDGTTDVLRRHESDGVLTYIFQPGTDYSQDIWVTQMAEVAQDNQNPDWLIHCDADEFWWPEHHRDLKQAFAAQPLEAKAIRVPRYNFAGPPRGGDDPFFERLVFRQRAPRNFLGEPLPGKIAHRPLRSPAVSQGNHALFEDGCALSPFPAEGLDILHFPARVPDQLRAKVTTGAVAYQRNRRLPPESGATWRAMFEALKADAFDRVIERVFVEPDEVDAEAYVIDRRLRDYLSGL